MRHPCSRFAFAIALAAAAACSGNPAPETAAPQSGAPPAGGAAAAPSPASLAGDWSITLLVQGNSTDGAIRLRETSDGSYRGFMQLERENQPYSVRLVRLEGTHFVITLDTPDGEATIEGNRRGLTRFDALYISRHTSGRVMGTRQ
jgi:hypothetical protein